MNEARPITLSWLFLDIDGVLLRRRQSGMFDGFELAPHWLEFLGMGYGAVSLPLAVVAMPNRVPWGPFRTSTLPTSK